MNIIHREHSLIRNFHSTSKKLYNFSFLLFVFFFRNKAIPQKLKHSQAKEKYPPSFYNNNDTQFDEMSSFNDMQGNSLSMQNE